MSLESRRERADRLIADIDEALKNDSNQVIWRYANTLAALRTVWKSRRQLQEQVAQLAADSRKISLSDKLRSRGQNEYIAILGAERDSARKRAAELEAFVADIACHGLRTDLTPTFMVSSPHQYAEAALRYLRSADKNLRADARKFVPDADRPSNAGRPIPAPKVEIVADPETELGVLLAQDPEGGAQ